MALALLITLDWCILFILESFALYQVPSSQPLTYFRRLMNDVIERTSTAMEQDHCLKVMNLAINAQLNAKRMGNLK